MWSQKLKVKFWTKNENGKTTKTEKKKRKEKNMKEDMYEKEKGYTQ